MLAGLAFAAQVRRRGVLPGSADPGGGGGAGAAMPVDQEQVPVAR